jgi:hypothetical protein
VTERVRGLLGDRFVFRERGTIEVKARARCGPTSSSAGPQVPRRSSSPHAAPTLRVAHDLAHSALPDAPVRDDLAATADRPLRRRAARGLRRLADRLKPIPTVSAGTG